MAQAIILDDIGSLKAFTASYKFVLRELSDSIVIVIISFVIGVVLPLVPYVGFILSLLSIPYIYGIATLFYIDRKEVSEKDKSYRIEDYDQPNCIGFAGFDSSYRSIQRS